jgi:hypothetical protein
LDCQLADTTGRFSAMGNAMKAISSKLQRVESTLADP